MFWMKEKKWPAQAKILCCQIWKCADEQWCDKTVRVARLCFFFLFFPLNFIYRIDNIEFNNSLHMSLVLHLLHTSFLPFSGTQEIQFLNVFTETYWKYLRWTWTLMTKREIIGNYVLLSCLHWGSNSWYSLAEELVYMTHNRCSLHCMLAVKFFFSWGWSHELNVRNTITWYIIILMALRTK